MLRLALVRTARPRRRVVGIDVEVGPFWLDLEWGWGALVVRAPGLLLNVEPAHRRSVFVGLRW